MEGISQVAKLTGVSIRTLQYYDEIGLLKQDRLDRLIQLLEHLEKGEQCMSFKEFDLSDYINALEDFKFNQAETVIQHWGSIENFDMFIQKIKDDKEHVAKLTIQQFGSIEKYTEEMKHNLEHFSGIMEDWYSQIPEEMRTEDKFVKLTSHKGEDTALEPVQSIEIIASTQTTTSKLLVGSAENYCRMMIDAYSNDYLSKVFDTKHGAGSIAYIVKAFRYYPKITAQKTIRATGHKSPPEMFILSAFPGAVCYSNSTKPNQFCLEFQ